MLNHPKFVCPVCRYELTIAAAAYECVNCRHRFFIQDGLPIFVADAELDSFKLAEQKFHDEISKTASSRSLTGRNSIFHWHYLTPLRNLPDRATVLEVACGTRADSIEIAQSGKLVTAFDISPVSALRARDLATTANVSERMRFAVADAERMPFNDNSFDAVFIAASFHHLPHQDIALKEFARVAKPGGLVIWAFEPARWPYRTIYRWLEPVKKIIRAKQERQHNSVGDDETEGYTVTMIKTMFAAAGLQIIDIRRISYFDAIYQQLLRFVGRILKRPIKNWGPLDRMLARIDNVWRFVPLLNRWNWYFNVIAKKKTG